MLACDFQSVLFQRFHNAKCGKRYSKEQRICNENAFPQFAFDKRHWHIRQFVTLRPFGEPANQGNGEYALPLCVRYLGPMRKDHGKFQ
jgi:hypothetical protein